MMNEVTVVHSEPGRQATTHMVHALMQFLAAARYRKNVIVLSLALAGLLGGLYYSTATRYYSARAQLLVMRTDPGNLSASMTSDGARQRNLMPTFEGLFTSNKVIEGAFRHLRPEDCIDLGDAPQSAWPELVKANLTAQTVQNTNLVEVSYRSKDPKAAVNMVNALVTSYVEFLDQTHKGTASEVVEILTREKTSLVGQLRQKEQELQQVQRAVGAFASDTEGNAIHPDVEQARSAFKSLEETHRRRIELEANLAAIQAAIRRGEDLQQHAIAVADVVGKELLLSMLGINRENAYVMADMERGLLDDRAKLAKMQEQEHLGPAHPQVRAQAERIRMTEGFLLNYQQQISQKLAEMQSSQLGPMLTQMVKQQLDRTWQEEMRLNAWYTEAKAKALALQDQIVRLDFVKHEVEWYRKEYDRLLDSLTSIRLTHDGQEVRTRVSQDPVQATKPVSPNLRKVILLSVLGGLTLGLGLVYVLDILDDRFRSVEEMQGQLNVPVLAMVRQLQPIEATGLESLQVHMAPNSAESEAFRTLRTALALADKEARQIVISSAEPGDGKTTVLANLAVTYAQSDKRTLLIDADLRRPGMTALMGMRGFDGLSGVVRGQESVAEMSTARIRASGIEGLDVLPSGPRPTNPAELLAHPRFSELLTWAESVYDQVLIDSPPVLATSDAAVIGRLVDGLVIVVQPDKNRRRTVVRAIESLTALRIPLLGVVLNRIGVEGDRGYYSYGYDYGYAPGYGADEDEGTEPAAPVDVGTEERGVAQADARVVGQTAFSGGVVPRHVVRS